MLSWLSVDARTGNIIADLPNLSVQGALKRTIGRAESLTAKLPLAVGPAAPPSNWLRATEPRNTVVIAVDADTNVPVWGGFVTSRTRGSAETVDLGLSTAEWYFGSRYVGTVNYTAVDQNTIVASLVNSYILDGAAGKPGLPIRVQAVGTGQIRNEPYYDYNDITVGSALTTLMGLLGGPEFTVEWEWQHAPERVTPVLFVGSPIGSHPNAGMAPAATFEMPGPVTQAQLVEDYGAGKGANDIMAVSSGQGIARPNSGHYLVADFGGAPTYEYRFSPQSSQLIVTSLAQHAQQALAAIGNGTNAVTLTAAASEAPTLGTDWMLGDVVGYNIGGLDQLGIETVAGFPGGLSGTARVIGWELTDDATPLVTPILYVPTVYTGS